MISHEAIFTLRDLYLSSTKLSPTELANKNIRELAQLVNHARSHSAFWQEKLPSPESWNSLALSEILSQLPTFTRADLSAHETAMRVIPKGSNAKEFGGFATSGSTGQPVRGLRHRPSFLVEQSAWSLFEWAWQGRRESARLLSFRIHGESIDNQPAPPPLSLLPGNLLMTQRSSTESLISELVEILLKIQPDYLFVNGVTLRLVCEEILRLNLGPITVEQVLAVSDSVDEQLRRVTLQALGATIADRYSTEEFGVIAYDCPSLQHLHVLQPSVIVEIVDDCGNAVEAGAPGRILITGLHSFAQPLIRYEVGDIGEWDPVPCSLGITWPALRAIHGRVRQQLNGRLITFVDAEFLRLERLLDQFVLRFDDGIAVFAVGPALTPADIQVLSRSLQDVFATSDPIQVNAVPSLESLGRVKCREFQVISGQMPRNLDLFTVESLLAANS